MYVILVHQTCYCVNRYREYYITLQYSKLCYCYCKLTIGSPLLFIHSTNLQAILYALHYLLVWNSTQSVIRGAIMVDVSYNQVNEDIRSMLSAYNKSLLSLKTSLARASTAYHMYPLQGIVLWSNVCSVPLLTTSITSTLTCELISYRNLVYWFSTFSFFFIGSYQTKLCINYTTTILLLVPVDE